MPRVVVVLGLCGSGKSTRATELESTGFINFDEKATGCPIHPDLEAWPSSRYRDLVQSVAAGRDCVVTDILFLQRAYQEHLIRELSSSRPDVTIEWECYDMADVDTANFNCKHDPTRTADGVRANLEHNQRTQAYLRAGLYALPPTCKTLKSVRRALS